MTRHARAVWLVAGAVASCAQPVPPPRDAPPASDLRRLVPLSFDGEVLRTLTSRVGAEHVETRDRVGASVRLAVETAGETVVSVRMGDAVADLAVSAERIARLEAGRRVPLDRTGEGSADGLAASCARFSAQLLHAPPQTALDATRVTEEWTLCPDQIPAWTRSVEFPAGARVETFAPQVGVGPGTAGLAP